MKTRLAFAVIILAGVTAPARAPFAKPDRGGAMGLLFASELLTSK
jgi:hypothetical protein